MAVIKNFDEIVERVKGFPEPMRVIVAAAQDEHTLQAIKHAQEEGIAKPVLVGDKAEIDKICAEIGLVVPEEDIYDVPDVDESARRAVVDSLTWEPTDEFDKGCGLCMAYGNEDFADWASGFFADITEEGLWAQMQSDAAAQLDETALEDFIVD